MFQDQDIGKASPNVEIYSPLATADNETLDRGYQRLSPPLVNRPPMKLLRTVSDDGTMTQLMLDELKLRRVDRPPACVVATVPSAGSIHPARARYGAATTASP
jgi:hypothetical protein